MPENIKIYLEHLDNDYLEPLQNGLSFIDLPRKVRHGDTVFIKPNLTYPYYKKGVTTSLECIEKLVLALKDYSLNIIIGEADSGGYNRFSMDEVYEKTGLRSFAKKYGAELVNLSYLPSRNIIFNHKGREVAVPLPKLLLDDVQLFITAPVPKIHMHTGVSMSIKNQWGCIQEPSLRLKLHPSFIRVIKEINSALKVGISIIDGRYGLNRNGPLRGDPTYLGWLMVADNLLAADIVCSTLMGIEPSSIKHIRSYNCNGNLPPLDEFHFNQDYKRFIGPKFYLKREILDYPGHFAFRSPFLAYVAYHSPLSKILHKFLYLFREKFYDHE
jgi:uncharacterized protein (DUF362 family)